MEHDFSNWKAEVEPVIQSKAEEWNLLGYHRVSKEDVWKCFLEKVKKMEVPDQVRPHWVVSVIFSLKVNDYMNYLTIEAYKGPSWFNDEEPIRL
ncbi:post-transcriptional regulator [Bacillus shivajii]|uniref:post-transcriptional regulator n=1 Tax=Bacillus shivajii TaxID=1983719 RepID=UPI001CFA0416|nr:post-transcriptional regulator [Bacillus shivajii]UCZ54358.1 post-transcriptional regulator [Bacillus shivajii]